MPWSSANTKIQRALSMLDSTEKQNGGLLAFDGTAIPTATPPQVGTVGFDTNGRVVGFRNGNWQPGIGYKVTVTITGASDSGTFTVLNTISSAPSAYFLLTVERVTAGAASVAASYSVAAGSPADTVTIKLDAAPGVGESVKVHVVIY